MECLAVTKLPDGQEWVYEIKLDAHRISRISCWKCESVLKASGKSGFHQTRHVSFDPLSPLPASGGNRPSGTCKAGIQELAFVEATKKLNQLSDQARPSGLVVGSDTGTVVSVKVFVE
jgi:hypothetical protein